jgi:putative exporter of polyketide antibiotics
LLLRVGPQHLAGIMQPASAFVSDLLRWTILGSVALVVALTAGTISSERGTMADSVLSRGISRYQYFLGKWHARLATVLCTFVLMGLAVLLSAYFLLHEDLKLVGCLLALVTVAAILGLVVSCGVAVSAMVNSTLLGVAVLWLLLYGGSFALSQLPGTFPSPEKALNLLPSLVRGYYDLQAIGRLIGWSALASCTLALVGMTYFSRRDV